MQAWWNHLMTDEAYFATTVAKVGRFALSVAAVGVSHWLGAPEWLSAMAGSLGLLVNAGDKNP